MSAHNYQVVCIIQIILSRIYNNNPSKRLGEYELSFLTENDVLVNFGLFLAFIYYSRQDQQQPRLYQNQFSGPIYRLIYQAYDPS